MNFRPFSSRIRITVKAVLYLFACFWLTFGKTGGNGDIWRDKENLSLRLTAEWRKIGILKRESSEIADILSEIRDFELYPDSLTGFDEKELLEFDRSVETLEKRHVQIEEEIDALKAPLIDAISILREMVVGDPVEGMFMTLEKGNLRRIAVMLAIKHDIDSLWKQTDGLLSEFMRSTGVPVEDKVSPEQTEDEFFTILKANLGLQSESYHSRLDEIKRLLADRADTEQLTEMAGIERRAVDHYISKGKFSSAKRKITGFILRNPGNADLSEFRMLLARIAFMEGSYSEALSTLRMIPADKADRRLGCLLRAQSFYALHEYDSLLADTSDMPFEVLSGGDLNLVLWLLIESSLALQKYDLVIPFAGRVEKGKPYGIHVLHGVARRYLAIKDDTTALEVLEKALEQKASTEEDRNALDEVHIAIAQLNYELKRYDRAVELFYKQLNKPDLFERALFGITWCYLESNMFEKAETALRKLINQAPEKSTGAEAILILARRYLQKAAFAWKKHTFVMKERSRLARLLGRIETFESTGSSGAKRNDLTHARSEITSLLERVRAEKLADHGTIASYYDNIDRLCAFIEAHYNSGTFQEAEFSEKRERILSEIDSVMIEIESSKNRNVSPGTLSHAALERSRIKKIVDRASLFSTISLIDRHRWEREYADWRKSLLKQTVSQAKNSKTGDNAGSGTKDVVPSSLEALLRHEDSLEAIYSGKLQEKAEQLLSTNLDPNDACYLNYHLGELYYRIENNAYVRRLERHEKEQARYELELQRYRNGERIDLPVEPGAPVLRHEKSVSLYRAAIAANRLSPFCAASHYSMAWCFNDCAQFDSAYAHMYMVALQFPESPHAAQAWMFCGEYHFDKGDLKEALSAFYAVMKYPESEWFDEALYKVAWTQYRLSNPEKAISSFLALVDLGGDRLGHSLLEKESMDYIAISFSETDISGEKGLQRAAAFARKLGDIDRGCQILHRLAKVFRDQGRHDMAKRAYNLVLSNYPRYSGNPQIEAELLTLMERDETTERSMGQKYSYFRKYHHTGEWAQRQPDSIRSLADSTSAKMLYDAAIGFHQLALQKNGEKLYRSALEAYTDYISSYPRNPLANECHYNLAEIQFSLGNYRQAAEEYIAVSRRYPDSKYKETAAWNAIVASQNLLKLENASTRQR